MDDGHGRSFEPRTQSPGYDIGPDEDRHYNHTQSTTVDVLVLDLDNNPNEFRYEQALIRNPPNGRFEEFLDETPNRLTDVPDMNRMDKAFYLEINRLKTFEGNWQDGYFISPVDLARNGFVYTGPGDKVKCVFCLKYLWNWDPGDSVDVEHRRFYPNCPFVKGQCEHLNVPQNQSENMQRSFGLHLKPNEQEYPKQVDFSRRLVSYQNWPKSAPIRPDALADAGFLYLGTEDKVQCFSCGIILSNMQAGDDPWIEHARQASDCQYVLSRKGSEFVWQAHESLMQDVNSMGCSASYEDMIAENKSSAIRPGQSTYKSPAVMSLHQERQRSDIDDDFRNPTVVAVMDVCDLSVEQMRKKLEQIRLTKGPNYKITTNDFEDLNV